MPKTKLILAADVNEFVGAAHASENVLMMQHTHASHTRVTDSCKYTYIEMSK
jgi:hypothetical protein